MGFLKRVREVFGRGKAPRDPRPWEEIFLADFVEAEPGVHVGAFALYDAYARWCLWKGVPAVSPAAFRNEVWKFRPGARLVAIRTPAGTARIYMGIRLKRRADG